MRTEAFALILHKEQKKMQTFKSFSEEKGVTLTGGGKSVTLKPGQNVSFTHHETGKKVSGTFRKKKMMGGRQYAHVDMPDKTGMYVPVHHINEAVDEGYMHIGPADGSSPYNKFGDKKPGTRTLGNDSKREKRDMEPRSPVKKNINDRLTTTREEVVHEKMTDDTKKNIQRALGSKHQSNTLRKTSSAAKAMIAIAKSNPKNMK
jgi:hypothetical protein